MKKTILLLTFTFVSMCLNAQTILKSNNAQKKFYIEVISGPNRDYKVHSIDSCSLIKQTVFDDQTKVIVAEEEPATTLQSPYRRLAYSLCYVCDKCMTEELAVEFKRRLEAFIRSEY